MTKMLNVVTVMAVLARDPEFSYVGANGTPKVSITLAGERVGVRDGQAVSTPFYLPAVQLGKGAEVLMERGVQAGSAVLAVCAFDYDSWEADGGQRSRVGLKVLRTEVIEGELETVTDSGGGVRLKGGFADVLIVGNLTRDADLRYSPSGDAVLGLSVAVNESFTDRGGQEVTKVHFVDVTVWRELAEACRDLKKGMAVLVKGSAKNESWTDKEGNKRSTLKVEASVVEVLARAPKAEGQAKREPVAAGVAKGGAKPQAGRSGGLDIDQGLPDFPAEEDDLPF